MFRPDNGGSTYFFVDFDYSLKAMGAYWEIARELNFWREVRAWQNTEYILLTEPQFWVNLNKIKGLDRVNLSVGGDIK